ncbi:hypothetical protein AX774_g6602, partial [Zancudomyces culisetae]
EKVNLIWDGAPASCTYCKKEGHWKSECPELAKLRKRGSPDRYREIKLMIAEGNNQIEQERQKEVEMNKELGMQNELENRHEHKRQEQEKHQNRERHQKKAKKEAEIEGARENENFIEDNENRMDERYDSAENIEDPKQTEKEKQDDIVLENLIYQTLFVEQNLSQNQLYAPHAQAEEIRTGIPPEQYNSFIGILDIHVDLMKTYPSTTVINTMDI